MADIYHDITILITLQQRALFLKSGNGILNLIIAFKKNRDFVGAAL